MTTKTAPERLAERNPQAKLTWRAVADVRIRLANGEAMKAIGLAYGVDRKTISNIANNVTWKDSA